jgi:chemotaxis protein methyltransferase CheR
VSAALQRVAELVRHRTGIVVSGVQLPSLEAALVRVDPALDAAAFLRIDTERGEGRKLLDRLIDEVTVNETFFFRQRRELDAIDWPRLLDGARAAGRDSVRVWVAACSSGEEAYTLAILASEALGGAARVSILATDISAAVLERGRRARYRGRAIRTLDPDVRRRYFRDAGRGVEVDPQIRELVEFRRHNLVTDPPPAPGARSFDLIACRNVLIYFDGDTVEQVIGLLERCLAPGGMLLLGAADRLCGSARRLAAIDRPEPVPARRRVLRRPLGRDAVEASPAAASAPRAGLVQGPLAAALRAANEGRLGDTLELTERLVGDDPLDANAYFVRGLAELGIGDPDSAAISLRRALYVDPAFGVAAFQLGRAHEERGDATAAARAYEQALRTLESGDGRHDAVLDQVDVGDIAAACTLRLRALRRAA